MRNSVFIYIIIFFIVGCSSWKATLVSHGDQNDAIHNAIIDFMHTCSLRKNDSIFYVNVYANEQTLLIIGISGTDENKFFPRPMDRIGAYSSGFPSRYLIRNNKLFCWKDSTYAITSEIIEILNKYNHVDSMNVDSIIEIPNFIILESKKGADYYFCKNNLRNYKKVITNVGMGWYPRPKLDCSKPLRKGK